MYDCFYCEWQVERNEAERDGKQHDRYVLGAVAASNVSDSFRRCLIVPALATAVVVVVVVVTRLEHC